MPQVILYSDELSPPCRAVLVTAAAISVDLVVRETNLLNGEHLTEDFLKINPQHTVPTMDDNRFVLWDSHAIVCYLVDKYATDDSLFPKDLRTRAVINQRLHFDTSVLFGSLRAIVKPLLILGERSVPKEKTDALREAYAFLEKFLEDKQWLAGDSYTVADICCVTTTSALTAIVPLDDYPNIAAWLARCEQELPGYDKYSEPGNKRLKEAIRKSLAQA